MTSSPTPESAKLIECKACKAMIEPTDAEANLMVCPKCGRHFRASARQRIAFTADPGSFEETHTQLRTADPLQFAVGGETYGQRIDRAMKQSGLSEALITGFARIQDQPCVLGAMDSSFIMASMGSALGERFCRAVRDAVARHCPLVVFAASGGARMQEGTVALMQMAKTADAVRQMKEAGLPYISILTDPTSGGVFASFSTLGDFIVAEPGAYVGFAGTRLIEGALKVKLPEGFQKSEYQFKNGFLDDIVPRTEMRSYLGRLLLYLSKPLQKVAQN